jgi:signal transduction histidine kinase
MPLTIDPEWFGVAERPALAWLRCVCEESRHTLEREACAAFPSLPVGASFERIWQDVLRALDGDLDPLRWRLSALGVHAAYSGLALSIINEATQQLRRRLVHQLIAAYSRDADQLEAVLSVMQRLFDRGLWTITREYLLHREAMMEEQRRNELKQLQRAEQMRLHSVELEAENRRIREVSRLKSEFLANMSHELRTPLNSIIGFTDLLHDGEVPAAEQVELLGDILRSAKHLLKLINDVLDLAKVEAGKLEFCPDELDFGQLAHEVVEALRTLSSAHHVTLSVDVDPCLARVWLDPARLRQVLYNYLSNALKFTPAGGRVSIRGSIDRERRLWVEVEDDGVGIPASDLNRLFSEFEQLPGTPGGTGLGLALTRRIVEAQGGEVGVRSEQGHGSTFWASLPAALPRERPERPSSYFEQLRPTGTRQSGIIEIEPSDALERSGT